MAVPALDKSEEHLAVQTSAASASVAPSSGAPSSGAYLSNARPSSVRPSSVRLRVATSLKFEDGPDNALTAVEFEAPPKPTVLHALCSALGEKQVSIVDSATRITPRALFQRFQLRELDGGYLLGARRREVETLFVEILAEL
jgi:UTP:GlnB (protein PII) uridylyltransferase